MKKKVCVFSLCLILVFILGACSPTTAEPPLIFEIPDTGLPLSEDGPYAYAKINYVNYEDPQRDNRDISTTIYYPAEEDQADRRGAPFPLIICDHKMANKFGPRLASHGFVIVGINRIDYHHPWDENFFEQPLDYIFVLNQMADNPPEKLIGIIDTDHVGVWGYSFGGMNSITLSGARVDPEYYLQNCADPENTESGFEISSIQMMCGPFQNWDEFVQKAGSDLTDGADGLWEPITDDRILALIPMSGEGEWLFGPKGLADVNKPIIVTAGTNEVVYGENYRIFEEIGSSDKIFISFVGWSHGMIFEKLPNDQMTHIAIAFFSYHLKGMEEYASYFSEDYISNIDGLAWGWYEEE